MSIHHILLFKIERNVRSIRSRGKHDRIVYTRARSIVRSSFTKGGIFFSRLATEPSRDMREFLRFLDEFLPYTRESRAGMCGGCGGRGKETDFPRERNSDPRSAPSRTDWNDSNFPLSERLVPPFWLHFRYRPTTTNQKSL